VAGQAGGVTRIGEREDWRPSRGGPRGAAVPARPRCSVPRAVAAQQPSPDPLTPGTGQDHEAELTDLHLVAIAQDGLVDRLAVHIGAVEAAHVNHHELTTLTPKLRVTPDRKST